ncbi:MAG: cell division protein FtsZ [Dehalococcoidia bacterium]|jgi:cell division protein FtsZ|nr:cell division protein FtsZ [Chloroflexota bacterium]MDP6055953.1 cell division protein FtsZ [Dehalococcoidia bacterium]MDP7261850.1 cell division protein FtsZ [Dehalococcoidia bacterium]MDP7485539.1 cell division protein FtsZ [Dehalococcoidia bacterium]|tara:strand:- start:10507 stop:11667 length:1161 start_codon:yes stop_codon:yes gene_type:complete
MPDRNTPFIEGSVDTANIKVVGVGGGGQNAVNRMYRERVPEVEYISVNTDSQALDATSVPVRLRVGDQTARGLGVGGDPSKGRQCHEEDRDEIKEVLKGADLVFVAAGMGGGTGTGGAPVVAEIAQDLGALTVGVVTKPFAFEGAVRKKKALEGIEMLRDKVDTLIVIPNDRLLAISDEQLTMDRAFKLADDVLHQGIQSIAELILVPGEINLDFADVRAVMDHAGPAWMAIGTGSGENRAIEAAEQAINSPLLEVEIAGSKGVIFNITGGTDLTLDEVQRASEVIASTVHPDANIIFGTVTDSEMENEVKLTIIATGFPVAGEIEEEAESIARKALEDPASMAIPPFLRHHPAARARYRNGGMYRDAAEEAEQTEREEALVMADD